MKLKEGMIYSRSLGVQINFCVGLGIVATIGFAISLNLQISFLLKATFEAIFGFIAALYFVFSLILLKRWVEKQY